MRSLPRFPSGQASHPSSLISSSNLNTRQNIIHHHQTRHYLKKRSNQKSRERSQRCTKRLIRILTSYHFSHKRSQERPDDHPHRSKPKSRNETDRAPPDSILRSAKPPRKPNRHQEVQHQ